MKLIREKSKKQIEPVWDHEANDHGEPVEHRLTVRLRRKQLKEKFSSEKPKKHQDNPVSWKPRKESVLKRTR